MMDRDPALMKQRKIVMGAWDLAVAITYAIAFAIMYVIAMGTVQLLSPQGIAVQIAALAVIVPVASGWFKNISNKDKEMKLDISSGYYFISSPTKSLVEAYKQLEDQIREKREELKEEHPIVFISNLSYYPTRTNRRYVVAVSVIFTLRH